MLFHPAERPKPKTYDGKSKYVHAEQKYDGWRMTLVCEGGKLSAWGRNMRNWWTSLSDDIHDIASLMPDDTVIDGELYVPGMHATEVPRALKTRDPSMRFVGFAMPIRMGTCLRLQPLEYARLMIKDVGFATPRDFDYEMPVYATDDHVEHWRRVATQKGIEGLVLKESHWSGWWKVKPYSSIDGYVVGLKPGKGKHAGRLGSLEIAVRSRDGKSHIVVADVGTGGDEHWRDLDPVDLIGRVMEVLYDEVGAGGRLKFPRFGRWRPDKAADECTEDDLPK